MHRFDGEVTTFETTTSEIHGYVESYLGCKTVSIVDAGWVHGIDVVEIPARFVVDT